MIDYIKYYIQFFFAEYGNYVFYLLYFIFSVSVILFLIYYIDSKEVKENSKRYKYIAELLTKLSAEPLKQQYKYLHYLKSKSQLDKMNIDKQMMILVASDVPPTELVKKAISNFQKRAVYLKGLENAPQHQKHQRSFYSYVEKKLIRKLEKRSAPVVPTFKISFCYTSPKGRNSYRTDYSFSLEQILGYYMKIKKADEYKQSVQYQRSIMTDSLRYNVMKRDRFRCVLCGASASDGVRLHVDHICPISKGGKTEMSNLRTLCERCNLGKRDKYDPYGVN